MNITDFVKKIVKSDLWKAVILFLTITICYMTVRIVNSSLYEIPIKLSMILGIIVLLVYAGILNKKQKLTTEKIITLLMFAGFIMRIGYMAYTPCNVRSHDLWEIDINSSGHAAYILTLLTEHRLPDTNDIQFYQQPFFYMLGSSVSSLVNNLLGSSNPYNLVDATKIVSCTASCSTLFLTDKLSRKCGIGNKGRMVAVAFIAFLPTFFLTGGCISPDALAALFMVLEFFYTLKWYENASLQNTILLAIIYGLGVMTKFSCGTVALFTSGIFFYSLWKSIKQKNAVVYIKKFIIFGIISLPIGLWYSVRNYIKFGQPFGYVLQIPNTSDLYTGEYSLIARVLSVSLKNIVSTPYTHVLDDYNAPVYFLKSSLFGEFVFQIPGVFPCLLLYAEAVIVMVTLGAVIWQYKRNRMDCWGNLLLVMTVIFYLSVNLFYIRYPFGCSMDYRYMGFLSITSVTLLAKYYEKSDVCKNWFCKLLPQTLTCFCISSCITYLLI